MTPCTGPHEWGEPEAVTTSGPLDVSPEEREYEVLGFYRQCEKCFETENVEAEPGAVQDALAEARQEDLAEWDDPVARAEMLEEVEEAEATVAEFFGGEE